MEHTVFDVRGAGIVSDESFFLETGVYMDVSSRSGHHVTTQLILVHVAVVHEESKPVRDQLRTVSKRRIS
jgi:hypothetical protein